MSIASKVRGGGLTEKDVPLVDAVLGAVGPDGFHRLFGISAKRYAQNTERCRSSEWCCGSELQLTTFASALVHCRHEDAAAVASTTSYIAFLLYSAAMTDTSNSIFRYLDNRAKWNGMKEYARQYAMSVNDGNAANNNLSYTYTICALLATPVVWSLFGEGITDSGEVEGPEQFRRRVLDTFAPQGIDLSDTDVLEAITSNYLIWQSEIPGRGESMVSPIFNDKQAWISRLREVLG